MPLAVVNLDVIWVRKLFPGSVITAIIASYVLQL